jgi:hypothetical protein
MLEFSHLCVHVSVIKIWSVQVSYVTYIAISWMCRVTLREKLKTKTGKSARTSHVHFIAEGGIKGKGRQSTYFIPFSDVTPWRQQRF